MNEKKEFIPKGIESPQPNKKGLRALRVFSAASFLNDLGAEMIFPIWPVFVRNFLGLPLSFLGIVDGVGNALEALSQLFSGYLSDKYKKRKPFIGGGYFLAFLGRLGISFSSGGASLLGFRSLDRAGKLRDAPRDAYLAEVSEKGKRGYAFGILNSFDSLGAIFGIILSIILFPLLGFRNLIVLASIPTLLSVFLIFAFIRERHMASPKFHGIHFRDFPKNLKLLFAALGILALGNFSYSFVLIGAEQLGFSVSSVLLLYLVYTVASFTIAMPAGKLSDKIGRRAMLGMSYIFWFILLAGFIVVSGGAAVWLLFISYGLFKGSFDTVSRVFIAELAPAGLRASTLGFFRLIVGLLALPASFLAGILWEVVNFRTPFVVSLILTTISFILLLKVKN